jgi:hypothetical protein
MSASEEHSEGIPDDVIVVGYAGAMVALVLLLSGLALLVNSWTVQAAPSMLEHEPPAPEIHH